MGRPKWILRQGRRTSFGSCRSKVWLRSTEFEAAVRAASPPVDSAYCRGTQALQGRHRALVQCKPRSGLTGSTSLDSALAKDPNHAGETSWDYGLGYRPSTGPDQAIWVEVHCASTNDVNVVLNRLRRLESWLRNDACKLLKMTNAARGDSRFTWLTVGPFAIPQGSPQARALGKSGIAKIRRVPELL